VEAREIGRTGGCVCQVAREALFLPSYHHTPQGTAMAEPDAPSSPPELSGEERALAYNRAVNLHRFTADLELLSALASPAYLVHLAHTGCLHDAAFLRYLARLEATWRQPQYARFLRYPNAFFFLAALRRPEFRNAVGSEEWAREAALMVNKTWEGA